MDAKEALEAAREWFRKVADGDEGTDAALTSLSEAGVGVKALLLSVIRQSEADLAAAHAEICKLQGLDPATHTWPEWSSPANTLRWFAKLREDFDRAAPVAPAPAEGVEALAKFLCEEFDFGMDPIAGATWPEHENDDGYRGDRTYVRLQPSDVQARARENASRILLFLTQRAALRSGTAPEGKTERIMVGVEVDGGELAPRLQAIYRNFTTGHCPEMRKPGGCQLHNLHCGYPECDRRVALPAAPGEAK